MACNYSKQEMNFVVSKDCCSHTVKSVVDKIMRNVLYTLYALRATFCLDIHGLECMGLGGGGV